MPRWLCRLRVVELTLDHEAPYFSNMRRRNSRKVGGRGQPIAGGGFVVGLGIGAGPRGVGTGRTAWGLGLTCATGPQAVQPVRVCARALTRMLCCCCTVCVAAQDSDLNGVVDLRYTGGARMLLMLELGEGRWRFKVRA